MTDNPDISRYFSDKKAGSSDIFDDISRNRDGKAGNNTKPMDNKVEYKTTYKVVREKGEQDVCKIFHSADTTIQSDSAAATFFDMLGSSTSGGINLGISDTLAGGTGNMTQNNSDGSIFSATLTSDDIFKSSQVEAKPIRASEGDRMKDAWIPPESTRRALISMVTSPPGTYIPDREHLTMPGVILDTDMEDTVYETVSHYLGGAEAAKRKVLTASDVTQDERGLRELIQAGCYKAAVNLTKRLLTIYGQGVGRAGLPSKHTVHSIQLWFTRLALLVKLRSFSLANMESEPFGDLNRPDMFFQYYPELYGGRMGSIIPFSFRLLLAQLPAYLEKHQLALSRLHSMLSVIRKMLSNLKKELCEDGTPAELNPLDRSESIKLWTSRETRVLHAIINCALSYKDFSLAVDVLQVVINKEQNQVQLRNLQSAMGRILLQLGDVIAADKMFQLTRCNTPDIRSLVDSGLLSVAQNQFQEAYDSFCKASLMDPTNIMVLNNMAVCLLYLGRLKDAVNLLEGALQKSPNLALHESFLLNLCTLYELQTSFSRQAKLKLLSLVSQHKGDSLNVGCLKIEM